MANNLIVAQGTTIVLSKQPPANLAGSMQRLQIHTLKDLVSHGMVKSDATLTALLDAAKSATAGALTSRDTFTPFVPVRGTSRSDLRRYGSFIAATSTVSRTESESFWRIAREIEPVKLATVNPTSDLSALVSRGVLERLREFLKYFFNDVTIESGATLQLGGAVKNLSCHDLFIRRTGRIVIEGSGTQITAHSIKGER